MFLYNSREANTMAFKFLPILLGCLHIAAALPAITLQDLEVADDTMSVGSYIREVRAAAPQDYHKSYENEGDGEIGYSRKKSGGGKKGYQHFDSYHKKAGDNYEFEKADSFGHDEQGQAGAHSHPHEARELYRKPQSKRYKKAQRPRGPAYERHHEAASERDEREERPDDDQGEEKHFEELKEGAPDGNGGIEAFGHDPTDYILPEKYVHATDEDEQS